jgi:TPR repeat protein
MITVLFTKIVAAYLCFGFICFHQEPAQGRPVMDNQNKPHPESTASTYWLSDAEKSVLSDKANKGDKDAAFRLAQYYSFVDFYPDNELYWLERSATAGHAVAQYNLSYLLFNREKPDPGAALYWAEMAKKNGEKKAQVLIDEIRAAVR